MSEQSRNERHAARMQRKKAIIDQHIAEANIDTGIMILLTGNGKGKSSSAFGMVARAIGHGMKVGVVQFIKNRTDTGEEAFLGKHCEWHVMGDGFTWETQNFEADKARSEEAWAMAVKMLNDPSYDVVVLDELTYCLSYGYLDKTTIVRDIESRPEMQHVVVTGRAAVAELREIADTITELNDEKHAYKAGIRAQKGLEW
ncbi:cob(I)yrinic acid a,c-diamide adenosyltransferase [Chitinibacter fontanus]|uniref:Corrinoid adenosyltransferase n=1 Tax=Chitinibacter fontanus TaxID=1737446 RepID=A0A7D5ZFR9_9NEIS|nr:cob(I)yrinic acid a,c-diamide adenosyltransferase [Chitinibacter fontanus]QLI82826.1 cob(I)yrinic acid a,c-diamide adenosyltransferase [Chitinibacter fontanus]